MPSISAVATVGVAHGLAVPTAVGTGVGVAVTGALPAVAGGQVGVGVTDAVAVPVAVALMVLIAVAVAVGLTCPAAEVPVAVADWPGVAVAVGVAWVPLAEVAVAVAVEVGVLVAELGDAPGAELLEGAAVGVAALALLGGSVASCTSSPSTSIQVQLFARTLRTSDLTTRVSTSCNVVFCYGSME